MDTIIQYCYRTNLKVKIRKLRYTFCEVIGQDFKTSQCHLKLIYVLGAIDCLVKNAGTLTLVTLKTDIKCVLTF